MVTVIQMYFINFILLLRPALWELILSYFPGNERLVHDATNLKKLQYRKRALGAGDNLSLTS